ncbi:hypothetical protein GN956_G14660 [Arapaima gigas]
MDGKRQDLGRPSQWLRYFNIDRSQNKRIKSVVRNIEEYFDEFDSSFDAEKALSPLSPLYNSSTQESEDVELQQFNADPVRLVLEASGCPHVQEPGFMRTSSPIDGELEEGGHGGGDKEGDLRASPLLLDDDRFAPEKVPQSNQKTDSLATVLNIIVASFCPKHSTFLNNLVSTAATSFFCFLFFFFNQCSDGVLFLLDSRKQTLPVTIPVHPEPVEDFLILDDDLESPCRISIPKRSNTNKNQPTLVGEHLGATAKEDRVGGKAGHVVGEKPKQLKAARDQGNKEDNLPAHLKSKGKPGKATDVQLKAKQKRREEQEKVKNQNTDMTERQEDVLLSLSSPFFKIRHEAGSQDICKNQEAPPVGTEENVAKEKRKRRKRQDENDAANDLRAQQPGPSKKTKAQNLVEQRSKPTTEQGSGAVQKSPVSRKKAAAGRKRNAKACGLSVRTNVELTRAPSGEQQSHEELQDGALPPHAENNVSVSPSSPADDQYQPVLANKNRRSLAEEQSNGRTYLKSTKDRSLDRSEYASSEDADKRQRRKPGSWWLVNQNESHEASEDSSKIDKHKKLHLHKGKRPHRGQEFKNGETKLNSGTSKLSKRKKQLVKSPKPKGPSKVSGPSRQQEGTGEDRFKRPVEQLNPTSGDVVIGTFTSDRSSETPRKPRCSVGARGLRIDSGGSERHRRCPPSNWWEVQKFASDGSPEEPQGNAPKAFTTEQRKELSSRGPRTSSRETLPESLMAKNAKAAMTYFSAILTPGNAKATAVPKTAECLQGDPRSAARCSRTTVDDHQHSCSSPSIQAEGHGDVPSMAPMSPGHVTHAQDHPATLYQRHATKTPAAGGSQRARWSGRRSSDGESLKGFKSGPSSMIDPGIYEDHRAMSPLCDEGGVSQSTICQPPLSPIVLQVEDRADLVMWLQNVLSTSGQIALVAFKEPRRAFESVGTQEKLFVASSDGTSVITPEHFRWYGYRGRAMGVRLDLSSDSFCCGKVLLGSYMKKPLQVDTRAVSVYNILTSSLRVKINGVETVLSPGETFMVPRGHEYEICNLTAEPALLFYTRMLSEIV